MSKRFTDTEKWTDPWFIDLSPEDKLLWLYLVDNCNVAGIIDLSKRLAELSIGCKIDIDSFIEKSAGRIIVLDNNKLFIPKFLKFQYTTVSETCRPQTKVISILEDNVTVLHNHLSLIRYSLTDTLYNTLLDRVQEKEEVKDKVKEEVKDKTIGVSSGRKKVNETSNEPKKRPRNLIMDSLALLECSNLDQVTQSHWSKCARAMKLIKEVSPDVTPEEIERRGNNYHTHFKDAILTCTALASHWAKCEQPAARQNNTRQRSPELQLQLDKWGSRGKLVK